MSTQAAPGARLLNVLLVTALLLAGVTAWVALATKPGPAPAALPPRASGTPLPIDATGDPTVDIRFQDVVTGIVSMENDPHLRVDGPQARAMQCDLEALATHLSALFILQVRLNRLLQVEQWQFIQQRRWGELTRLDVPVPAAYAGLPDPVKTVRHAVWVVDAEAAKPLHDAGASPSPCFTPLRDDQEVSWFHISQAIILCSARYPALALKPPQARAMQRFMHQLALAIGSIETCEKRLVARLTSSQKTFILEQKHRSASREVNGRPILEPQARPSVAQALEIVRERAAAP